MKLSPHRKSDLETVMYFIPPACKGIPITEQDIQMFFENSEQGLHKEKIKISHFSDGFNALLQGKSWRGVHMGMWEEGILDGSVPYYDILKEVPRSVVDFMKKEMFGGKDAELIIERCYQDILKEKDAESQV